MFGPAPQHGGTQQGTCCFYKHSARIFGSRPKNLSLFGFTPSLRRPASGPAANLELLNVCKFRRGPRNRSCSLDVYLLSQRMLNFFIGLMLGTPFGFLLLVPFRAAFEDGLGALLPLWYQGQLL